MRSKLVFLNLLIDGQWSENNFLEQVFTVKSPDAVKLSRINEFLGRYYAGNGDFVITPDIQSDEDNHRFDDLIETPKVNWLPVDSLLQDIDEFSKKVSVGCAGQIRDHVFAGVSKLENKLLERLSLGKPFSAVELDQVKEFNRKDYLIKLSGELGFEIPKSSVVSGAQISKSGCLFKSLVSSGGSGVYGYSDLEKIKTWSIRKNLEKEWNQSQWLMQETVQPAMEFNCFGSTDSQDFNLVLIQYDGNRLSFEHIFNPVIDQAVSEELRNIFYKVQRHLVDKGYRGLFGFDAIQTQSNKLYPVTDLNIRMNKSHVLKQIQSRFKSAQPKAAFYRLRFVNNHWEKFEDFWTYLSKEVDKEIVLSKDDQLIPIDWSFWTLGKSECLVAFNFNDNKKREKLSAWVNRFLQSDLKGMHV
jgi:hypothetical protein